MEKFSLLIKIQFCCEWGALLEIDDKNNTPLYVLQVEFGKFDISI